MDVFCIILPKLFILAFIQEHISYTPFYIYTCITPKRGTESAHAEGPSVVEGFVCMRQTTGLVMTGVKLAKASSWLRYSWSIFCEKQTTSPVMTEVQLAKASIWLCYSRGSVCKKQTTGPVMTNVQLAKASFWLLYSRGSIYRKQMTGHMMAGVELETPKA
jgi:hypothetical protein